MRRASGSGRGRRSRRAGGWATARAWLRASGTPAFLLNDPTRGAPESSAGKPEPETPSPTLRSTNTRVTFRMARFQTDCKRPVCCCVTPGGFSSQQDGFRNAIEGWAKGGREEASSPFLQPASSSPSLAFSPPRSSPPAGMWTPRSRRAMQVVRSRGATFGSWAPKQAGLLGRM